MNTRQTGSSLKNRSFSTTINSGIIPKHAQRSRQEGW
jgi:hypothetical protein